MFVPKNTFENLIKSIKEPNITVCCNDCKHQENCIKNENIKIVTYPTGEKGYARTFTHHFSNTCTFPIDKY